jgi:hypothetical protein
VESLSKDETVAGFDIGSRSMELIVLNSGGPFRQVNVSTITEIQA